MQRPRPLFHLYTKARTVNLTIDIGNTLAKMTLLEHGRMVDTFRFEEADESHIRKVFRQTGGRIDGAIMISGADTPQAARIKEYAAFYAARFVDFTPAVPVPLKNLYLTPETLGADRLAAAVGAQVVYPASNVMVVDFGSAITVDMVSAAGEYLGGNISPGAAMRFKALNQFTGRLPLCSLREETGLHGNSTEEAICNGVVDGITYEIEGYIGRFSEKYGDFHIIFTGGDGNFFAKRIKNPIFATYDLVAFGLNRILEYNAH